MTVANNPRWKVRPPGSNWGDFGPDDELGRLNLLTPRKVLDGMKEVVEGKTFCLSLPLDVPGTKGWGSHRQPPRLRPAMRNGKPLFNFEMSAERPGATDVVSDDEVLLTLQYSTQWDSLAHVGQLFDVDGSGTPQPVYYNGFRANIDVCCDPGWSEPQASGAPQPEHLGARHLGVEKMAESCVQGRAVLIDLEKHFGRRNHAVTHAELLRILEVDRITVTQGDMVLFYTGFGDILLETHPAPDAKLLEQTAAIDGKDPGVQQWITDTGIVAMMSDNATVEYRHAFSPVTHGRGSYLPLHEHCLFKLGMPLGEMWNLGDLARYLRQVKRSAFLLTAPPLRLPGAVGSPASPVATV
ncbi:cyclase family protein [Ramlibacter sp.]|uniref:cyclase family protein n=1 Tax=Ramlibacter sp. TaxID=1917967 RepID=UPI003D148489